MTVLKLVIDYCSRLDLFAKQLYFSIYLFTFSCQNFVSTLNIHETSGLKNKTTIESREWI